MNINNTIIREDITSHKDLIINNTEREKEDKIKNIAILTKVISLELEQDLSILLKENLLKELKEVLLELDSILKEDKIERKIYE